MNISHTQNDEQQSDYEFSYINTLNAVKQNKAAAMSQKPALEKVLVLLGDSTPNYVLGYN